MKTHREKQPLVSNLSLLILHVINYRSIISLGLPIRLVSEVNRRILQSPEELLSFEDRFVKPNDALQSTTAGMAKKKPCFVIRVVCKHLHHRVIWLCWMRSLLTLPRLWGQDIHFQIHGHNLA